MTTADHFAVRDLRNKGIFFMDDQYLNGHASPCGIYATGVYVVLCRHADNQTQSCFPSVSTIARKLGISKRQVLRALKTLEAFNIIKAEKNGGRHNVYYLLDRKFWKTGDCQTPVTSGHLSGDCQTPEPVTDGHPKATHEGTQEGVVADKSTQSTPPRESAQSLFDYWNLLNIIQHRKIDKYRRHLSAALKSYSSEEIGDAMRNYKDVLDSPDHFFNYRWGLDDFLSRKSGLDKFLSVNDPFSNFRKGTKQ